MRKEEQNNLYLKGLNMTTRVYVGSRDELPWSLPQYQGHYMHINDPENEGYERTVICRG
jgi:hypothetical protein